MKIRSVQISIFIPLCLLCSCQKPPEQTPQEIAQKKARLQQIEQELNQSAKQFTTPNRVRVLVPGRSPALSPDGKKIAYEAAGKKGDRYIWIMDVNGQNQKQLTRLGWDAAPQWSPDSKSIIFQSYGEENPLDFRKFFGHTRSFTIWTIDLNGKNQRQLIQPIDSTESDQYPFWSPDGKYVVWSRSRSEDFSLWIANAQGEDARQLTVQTKEYLGISEGPNAHIDFHHQTSNQSQPITTLPCQAQVLVGLDNQENLNFPRTFGTVLQNKTSTHRYCIEKGNFHEIRADLSKPGKRLKLRDRFFVEYPNITADQKTLIFSLASKGGAYNSILMYTLLE